MPRRCNQKIWRRQFLCWIVFSRVVIFFQKLGEYFKSAILRIIIRYGSKTRALDLFHKNESLSKSIKANKIRSSRIT